MKSTQRNGAVSDPAMDDASSKLLAKVEQDIALFRLTEEDFAIMEKLVQEYPSDFFVHLILARCFERHGLSDMSGDQFKITEKLQTSSKDILKRLNYHTEAGEIGFGFRVPYPTSVADPGARLQYAQALIENGASNTAESVLKSLLEQPDCPLGAPTALSAIEMEQKQWLLAIALANRDLLVEPKFMAALLNKGESLVELGRGQQCIALLKIPLEEHPFNWRLNLIMYRAYRSIGDYDNALRCALRNLAGSDWISYFDKAQDRVKQLIKALPARRTDAIVSEIGQEVDRTNYAMKFHFYLGQVYFRLRMPKQARIQNEIALKMDPEFQPNWYEKGRLDEVFYDDYKSAGQIYKKAFKMQRSDYDKAFLGMQRMRKKAANQNRDIALKLKQALRHR